MGGDKGDSRCGPISQKPTFPTLLLLCKGLQDTGRLPVLTQLLALSGGSQPEAAGKKPSHTHTKVRRSKENSGYTTVSHQGWEYQHIISSSQTYKVNAISPHYTGANTEAQKG